VYVPFGMFSIKPLLWRLDYMIYISALMQMAASWIRVYGEDSFTILMVGQTLLSIS
jgi:hypothetical protein